METENLKKHLKEAYELEGQFYIYKQIEQLYKRTLNELESRRNSLYWFEEFAGEKKEDSEILNIDYLAKNIQSDTSYNRGNAFLLPLGGYRLCEGAICKRYVPKRKLDKRPHRIIIRRIQRIALLWILKCKVKHKKEKPNGFSFLVARGGFEPSTLRV